MRNSWIIVVSRSLGTAEFACDRPSYCRLFAIAPPARSSLRPERDADLRAGLEPIAAYQVEAIGDRGKDRVEAGPDRRRLPRQIDDQAAAAQSRELTREDRGRHLEQAARSHQLAEAWHEAIADRLGRLGRHVARAGAGAAGGEDQRTALDIGEFAQRRFDARLFVRDHAPNGAPWGREDRRERGLDARTALVLVDAGRGAIGNGDDADGNFAQCSRL